MVLGSFTILLERIAMISIIVNNQKLTHKLISNMTDKKLK